MSVTEQYIDLIIPSLSGEDSESLSIFKTDEGLIAYKMVCPFCGKFCKSDKSRKNQTAEIIPLKGSPKYKGYKWYFRCRRRYSPDCRGGYKSFYNFLCMYDTNLFSRYVQELHLGSNRREYQKLYNKIK